jgi:recombination protein RecA
MAAKKKIGIRIPSINEINKKYGDMIVTASETKESGLWLPSTFFALNYTFGGGIPFGKILEVAGEESSGKSLIAYNFAYSCQQLGGHVIWVDAEQSWMNSWAKENGVNPDKVTVIRDTRIEYVSDAVADIAIYLRSQLTNNEPILLVVDSIAAMDCADNIDSKMVDGKAEMGGRAKALYKYFRIRSELFYKLGITQIYINQLRTALNVGFGKDNSVTTGGAALKFYASIRAAFYSGKSITVKQKGKERKAGKLVTVRLIKNKVAPPRPTISKCPVYFNPKFHSVGFDRYYGLEDVLVENDIIEKSSGGVYKYKGKTLCRGEEKFIKLMEEDEDLRRKLLRAANINTIGSTNKKLGKLTENYYPVDDSVEYESFNDSEENDDYEEEA